MTNKQQEFYNQLRQETEQKVTTYSDFSSQIKHIEEESKKRVSTLKNDMKFIAKQIDSNNQMLTLQGLEPVKFEK